MALPRCTSFRWKALFSQTPLRPATGKGENDSHVYPGIGKEPIYSPKTAILLISPPAFFSVCSHLWNDFRPRSYGRQTGRRKEEETRAHEEVPSAFVRQDLCSIG
jgi:hypothetical protein